MKKKVAIIGSGISGLSAANYLSKAGIEVFIFEQHNQAGGRARQLKTDNGYIFDMGPSWYWMPDIIEKHFQEFGYTTADFYQLSLLDPQFEIVFKHHNLDVPADYNEMKNVFEKIEKGSGKKLDEFIQAAQFKYEEAMKNFIYKPCYSWREFFSLKIIKSFFKLNLLTNFKRYTHRYFKDTSLRLLMEFPVIFLGAPSQKIPAMYSLMNYGGYVLKTWYPQGGFYKLIEAFEYIAKKQGVTFLFNHKVEKIITDKKQTKGIIANGQTFYFDAVISSADYHHSEKLLNSEERNYNEDYWDKKIFAPSCLIYYLGFKRKISNLKHHTLFFDDDFDSHINAIYNNKEWPKNVLFYCCCTSKTDANVAPQGHENIFLLMPLAIGIEDNEALREKYFNIMIQRLEKHTQENNLINAIDYKKSYCIKNFIEDYNAYKGNAYGLANTLMQTAVLKPSLKNKKIKNLFYTGQLTVPGPGVPPSIISGKIVANELIKTLS